MVRFSLGGDWEEDESEEGRSNNRRSSKKPRTSSDPISNAVSKSASASTSASNGSTPASTSAAPQIPSIRESIPEERIRHVYRRKVRSDQNELYGFFHLSEDLFGEDEEDEEDEESDSVLEMDEQEPGDVFTEEETEDEIMGIRRGPPAPVPLSVTLTDPDVLDCVICFEPLNLPVYQCENGHTACAPCCTKMKNKCASCSFPIGYNRCRAIERVLESIRIPCTNTQYGCTDSFTYSRKLHHEKACKYPPITCPHPNCSITLSPKIIYSHFVSLHPNSFEKFTCDSTLSISLDSDQKYGFLCEEFERFIFVLNRAIEPRGSLVDVVCIGPGSLGRNFFYEVSASDGVSSIVLKSEVVKTECWNGQAPEKKYLLVPNDFMSSGGELKLGLTIKRASGWEEPEIPVFA